MPSFDDEIPGHDGIPGGPTGTILDPVCIRQLLERGVEFFFPVNPKDE